MILSFTATGRINKRLSVEVTAGSQRIVVEWDPALPSPGSLTAQEMHRYRRIRGEALRQLAAHMGGAVLVLEA